MKKNLLISLLMCIVPISLSSCSPYAYIMHEGTYTVEDGNNIYLQCQDSSQIGKNSTYSSTFYISDIVIKLKNTGIVDKDRQQALNEIKEKPSYKIYIIDFKISINDSPLTHYDLQFDSDPLMAPGANVQEIKIKEFNVFFPRNESSIIFPGYKSQTQSMSLELFSTNLNKDDLIHAYFTNSSVDIKLINE